MTEETSISRINHVLLPFYVHVGKIRDSLNKTKGSSIENASKAWDIGKVAIDWYLKKRRMALGSLYVIKTSELIRRPNSFSSSM